MSRAVYVLDGNLQDKIGITLDLQPIVGSIQQIVQWIGDIRGEFDSFKEESLRDKQEICVKLDKISHLEEGLVNCERNIGEMSRVKENVETWGQRFVAIEEKFVGMGQQYKEQQEMLKAVQDQIKSFTGIMKESKVDILKETDIKVQNLNKELNDRISHVHSKFEYITNELKDYDEFYINKLREEINQQVDYITQLFQGDFPKLNEIGSPQLEPDLNVSQESHEISNISEHQSGQDEGGNLKKANSFNERFRKTITMRRGFDNVSTQALENQIKEELVIINNKIHSTMKQISQLETRLNYFFPDDVPDFNFKRDFDRDIKSLNLEHPEQKQAFIQEYHLRFVVLVNELNSLKQLYNTIAPDISSEILKQDQIPNYGQYIPYMIRLKRIEEKQEKFISADDVKDIKTELERLWGSLHSKASQSESKIFSTQIGQLQKQIEMIANQGSGGLEIRPSVYDIAERSHEMSMMNENEERFSDISDNINRINKTLALKVGRNELEEILKNFSRGSYSASYEEGDDEGKVRELEIRLNKDWIEKEAFRKSCLEQFEIINTRLQEISDQIQQDFDDKLQSRVAEIQRELRQTAEEIKLLIPDVSQFAKVEEEDPFDFPAFIDYVHKLDTKIIHLEERIEKSIGQIDELSSTEGIDDGQVGQLGRLFNIISKHESSIFNLKNQLGKVTLDVENSQQALRKQHEYNIQQNVVQLEQLKSSMSDIMQKMKEGTRLNNQDMLKINQLYEMMDEKGNKSDVMRKVERQDLNRAYKALSSRIEGLQKELSTLEELRAAREDPIVLRKRLNDYECLACGQEVNNAPVGSTKRDWGAWGRFPRSTVKFGPGFSKMLPHIRTLTHDNTTQIYDTHTISIETPRLRQQPSLSRTPRPQQHLIKNGLVVS